MSRAQLVPVTPEVVEWAIAQSGYSVDDVAAAIHVSPTEIRNWVRGRERPTLTQARSLARKVKRPLAVLLLPRVPQTVMPNVEFRHPPGAHRRTLNPVERYRLREGARIQRAVAWALREMELEGRVLPQHSLHEDADRVAIWARSQFDVTVQEQRDWRSGSEALQRWREALEEWGLLVFLVPMGEESCRGFSIWDESAPLVAANTWWNVEARAFTLFHELGHLLTRTSSVCLDPSAVRRRQATDPAERWCEEFAASVLLPWEAVTEALAELGWDPSEDVNLSLVRRLAKRFKVSVRATAIRLIKHGLVGWSLYREIPPVTDHKRRGGGGGEGRVRPQVRLDEIGIRTSRVLLQAMDKDVLGATDVLEYLRLPDRDLDVLAQSVSA